MSATKKFVQSRPYRLCREAGTRSERRASRYRERVACSLGAGLRETIIVGSFHSTQPNSTIRYRFPNICYVAEGEAFRPPQSCYGFAPRAAVSSSGGTGGGTGDRGATMAEK